MNLIEQMKQLHGKTISKEVLENIKSNYFLSKHAQEQLKERSEYLISFDDGRINFGATKRKINEALDKNILAYYNTDGSVNIAMDRFHYFVFALNEERGNWTMITYKETSWYGIDIFEKQQMALEGFDRQYD